MKKIHLLLLFVVLAVYNYSSAQNVGIGVTNPAAKLDVAGTIKITDGSEGTGKILTSDISGMASWKARKKPRVIRVTDPNISCSVIHTPLYTSTFVLTDTADYTVTGKSLRLGTGRHDLNLIVDGILVQVVLTYTPPADGTQWAEAFFSYGGTFLPGSHNIQVAPADSAVPWGCGNLWGNMIITIFD
jgi:hypothetical protein